MEAREFVHRLTVDTEMQKIAWSGQISRDVAEDIRLRADFDAVELRLLSNHDTTGFELEVAIKDSTKTARILDKDVAGMLDQLITMIADRLLQSREKEQQEVLEQAAIAIFA
jgi:hypothetical protein